jgi:hypothetical protein
LYSQNLIAVQQIGKIDILSGTDGKIVRQFDYHIHSLYGSIIGPYCYLRGYRNNSLMINVETGETVQHYVKLPPSKLTTTPVEDTHDPSSTNQSSDLPIALESWPYCSCTGELIINNPERRNGLYLYSLSGF